MTEALAMQMIGVRKNGRRKPIGPLNLEIPSGYVVALVGPNGSGKSTIMNLILQTLQPDEGELSWFDRKIGGVLPTELRQLIGYVPEVPLYEENNKTAGEAAAFRAHWYPGWDQQRLEELLIRFEVPEKVKLSKMSKGERRKFEIAAALACRPKLLLLDEPSSGLDPFAWKHMIEVLRSCLEEEEITIVLSTHIVDEVKRLADYIALVHQGEVKGMVEKDALMGCWKELWVRASDRARLEGLADILEIHEAGPSGWRLRVQNAAQLEDILLERGVSILKSQGLELEDILTLWMKGRLPEEIKWKRGE
ncbi:ABC transporter ATP-binding protein [Paenibacillus sp. YPG26]|uniref:ABC transporter ATP-binding protein n=1 Tax=Paenibacillus sp. YPG26 TaxID=2878915 RepID=UPI0020425D5B|nr:ABC transporter ATP-binding protein [Paenibacillus sp. YPG26]USB33765.1 ABC transporter ATP-binding protein [Paenibacillus sp. YPG26]